MNQASPKQSARLFGREGNQLSLHKGFIGIGLVQLASNTMGKGTKLYSIFFNKCPRCQRGNFFAVNNAYNLKRFDQMNPQCACCGERFEKEPGYYTGALYVSYAYYTALIVGCFLVMEVVLEWELGYFLGVLIALIILLTPLFFRLARLTWINFFISFDAQKPTSCP